MFKGALTFNFIKKIKLWVKKPMVQVSSYRQPYLLLTCSSTEVLLSTGLCQGHILETYRLEEQLG